MSEKIRQPEQTTAASPALGSRLGPRAPAPRAPRIGSGRAITAAPGEEISRATKSTERLELTLFCEEESSREGEKAGRFRMVAAAELSVSSAGWEPSRPRVPSAPGEGARGRYEVSCSCPLRPRAPVGWRIAPSTEAGSARGVAGSTALARGRDDKNGEARRDAPPAL